MLSSCRICSSEKIKIIRKVKSPYFENTYSLYHCESCISRSFDPNEYENVSLEDLYENFAKELTNNHRIVNF